MNSLIVPLKVHSNLSLKDRHTENLSMSNLYEIAVHVSPLNQLLLDLKANNKMKLKTQSKVESLEWDEMTEERQSYSRGTEFDGEKHKACFLKTLLKSIKK